MSLKDLKDQYALTDNQAELLLMFKGSSPVTPLALYDVLAAAGAPRRSWSVQPLVDKGLLHRAQGECSEGYVCGVYWLDDLAVSHLEKED